MAELEIRLRFNRETGEKEIWVDYESDDDALRHEHEREHRRLIQQLLGSGVLDEQEVKRLRIKPRQEAEGSGVVLQVAAAKSGEGS